MNKFDGDTWSFKLEDINDGNQPIMFTNGSESVKYNNFRDFFKKMGGGQSIQVRALGIDSMEIPHYEVQLCKEEDYDKRVTETTFGKMKEMINGKTLITYENLNYDRKSGKVTERKNDDKVTL